MGKGYPRYQRLAIALGLALGAIGLWSCDRQAPPVASDPSGETATAAIAPIAPISDVRRAIALSSLPADILHQLAPDRLVGVAHDRTVATRDDLNQYANVGDGRDFDFDAIAALEPDLVVGLAGVHERALEKLAESGVPTLRVTVDGWTGLFAAIETLADATDADAAPLLDRYATVRDRLTLASEPQAQFAEPGSALAANSANSDTDNANELDAGKSDAGESDAGESEVGKAGETNAKTAEPGATLILASLDPLFSLNQKSWGGSTIALFSDNIAADLEEERAAAGYVTLAPEAIVAADPATILIVATPGNEEPIAGFAALPFWKELQAVKGDRVFLVDYYSFVKPATLDDIDAAIAQLAEIFAPSGDSGQTGDPPQDASARESAPEAAPEAAPESAARPSTESPSE
ncbi:MAG: ABC transporter substrate-binding protein [Geitlerinemataceae cyanobacterium]